MLGKIKLDDKFEIEATKLCWILKYESPTGLINKKTGKEIISRKQTYYPNINDALKKYVDLNLEPHKNATSILKAIKELHTKIDAITLKRDYPNQKTLKYGKQRTY